MARGVRRTASKKAGGISYRTVSAFFITLAMCTLLARVVVVNRSRVELLTMEQLILEKSIKVDDVIKKLLYKTQVISSLVQQHNGELENFEQIAAAIVDDPSIMNILIAPGGERFWGLVSVTLKYPQALEGAGLSALQAQGFAYEIWRVSPDTNENQIISASGHDYKKNTHYVERNIQILNADWYFRILPVRIWYEFPETWLAALISMCVSTLIAAMVQSNHDLKRRKDKLEILSNTDSLTGIYNRRYFMNTVAKQIDRTVRINGEAYIILFDLDYFKKINDEYRHRAGDMVLKELCVRVAGALRSSDLFARYGGEEFILYVSDIDNPTVMRFTERIRRIIAETPVVVGDFSITVTASFGVAPVLSADSLDDAIAKADEALYRAKDKGRNRVVIFENMTEKAC